MNAEASGTDSSLPSASLSTLTLGALGVVFGDIGTSPLYTMKEVFDGPHPLPISIDNVLGILSLIFWSLTLVVSIKYVTFVMRADNRGEGGIMAMLALVNRTTHTLPKLTKILALLGIFGASLFYGDSIITPAISVLSAVEGISVVTPALNEWVIPVSLGILVALFLIQSKGTERVGILFGPLMLFWFSILAVLGIINIMHHPSVLTALLPTYAIHFFVEHGGYGFMVLGSVVLAVTGAEALYADMGHFGKNAIRLAWFLLVLPALLLNYFGQGALLIANPAALENPFYHLSPGWALLPMVGLATAATIIASQAVISGAFSVTRQAIQLGYLPRLEIRHTSEQSIGQIYIPFINWFLLAGIIALILGFQSSSHLASAYGIAVTGTMAIDTILGFVVVTFLWHWNRVITVLGMLIFLTVDIAFFSANSVKLLHGGWFPLAIALIVFTFLSTWKKGRRLLMRNMKSDSVPLEPFIKGLIENPPTQVPGTAVFLSTSPDFVPRAFLHNLLHNKVVHERVVFVTVVTEDIPVVSGEERLELRQIGGNYHQVAIHYGFMQTPNIPKALSRCSIWGGNFNLLDTSFFFSRETLIASKKPGMALWREKIFAWMTRNAQSAMLFFRIPTGRVIELGAQVEL